MRGVGVGVVDFEKKSSCKSLSEEKNWVGAGVVDFEKKNSCKSLSEEKNCMQHK